MNITEDNIDRWLQGCKLYTYEKTQLIQQIISDQEKAEKWDRYSQIIETILQLDKDFNTLKEDEMKRLVPQYLFMIKDGKVSDVQPVNPKYIEMLEENKRLKETIHLINGLVNLHDGSDYHARMLFDKIEELLTTTEGDCKNA